jgi:hypothetical protein
MDELKGHIGRPYLRLVGGLASELVLLIPWRVRIIPRRHRVGIPPFAIDPLNANFASPVLSDRLPGSLFSGLLGLMQTAGTPGARRFNCPALGMPDDIAIILGHFCTPELDGVAPMS